MRRDHMGAHPEKEERRPGTGGASKNKPNSNSGRDSRSRRPGQAARPSARTLKAARDLFAPWRPL